MNAALVVNKAKRFGDNFCVIYQQRSTVLKDNICRELSALGCNFVEVSEDSYNSHAFPAHDVILFLNCDVHHREDSQPKTLLCVGNDTVLSYCDTMDQWKWQNDDFYQSRPATKTTLMPISENLANTSGSWRTAIEISFKKLLPYVDEKIIYPVYAGPIQEHAIDKLSTLELVDHVKQAFYQGYERIVFDDKDEAIFWHRIYKVHSVIKRLENIVPPGSFFFLTSALNGNEIYKEWCQLYNEKELLIMICCARFESVAKDMMMENGILEHYDELDFVVSTAPRPKKFLCYNRMPRLHRVKLLTELKKRNLTDSGLISFHDEDSALSNSQWRHPQNTIGHYGDNVHWLETFNYFYTHIFPNLHEYKINKTEERWNPVDVQRDDLQHFTDTYFSIVNETLFYKDTYEYAQLCDISPTNSIFLSEKIFKPLACKHPFVVIGVDGTLEHLRKYGYKTFDGWINESYDLEPDDDKRMEMCINEIERLTNMSDDQWQEIIEEMTPTLQHNFETLCRNKNLIVSNINMLEIFRNNKPY